MLDTTAIDTWLAGYRQAWSTDSPDDILAIFEPDARYRTAPFRAPHVGHAAIVEWWIGQGDSALTWDFEYEVIAREEGLYVIKGVTIYPGGLETKNRLEVFDNIWLVTLSRQGRATEFVEYWMLRD